MHRMTEQTDSSKRGGGRGDCFKEGKGMIPGTYMKDPWTCATGCGLTTKVGGGLGKKGKGGNHWNQCKA